MFSDLFFLILALGILTSNEFKHLGQIDCVVGEPVTVECDIYQDSSW